MKGIVGKFSSYLFGRPPKVHNPPNCSGWVLNPPAQEMLEGMSVAQLQLGIEVLKRFLWGKPRNVPVFSAPRAQASHSSRLVQIHSCFHSDCVVIKSLTGPFPPGCMQDKVAGWTFLLQAHVPYTSSKLIPTHQDLFDCWYKWDLFQFAHRRIYFEKHPCSSSPPLPVGEMVTHRVRVRCAGEQHELRLGTKAAAAAAQRALQAAEPRRFKADSPGPRRPIILQCQRYVYIDRFWSICPYFGHFFQGLWNFCSGVECPKAHTMVWVTVVESPFQFPLNTRHLHTRFYGLNVLGEFPFCI